MNIIIFASGSGTNAEKLIEYFSDSADIQVSGVFSNKPDAFVLERAKKHQIPSEVFTNGEFKSETFLEKLLPYQPDFIILAGFLRKVPDYLIAKFPDRIINIHPALLPKYGGKGMYGSFVHEAVIANKESSSGITIHLVNENYDEGRVLFQASCDIDENDTPDSLAAKVHQLEHQHFPKIVADYIADSTGKK